MFILPEPVRIGADVEWGDIGSFDVRSSDGLVVALDRFAGSVFVLSDSLPPRRIGRRGDGPGELQAAGPIVIQGERIFVFDPGRVSTFSVGGEFVTSVSSRSARAAFAWSDSTVASVVADQAEFGRSWVVLGWHADLREAVDTIFRIAQVDGVPADSLAAGGALYGREDFGLVGTLRANSSPPIHIEPGSGTARRWPPISRDQAEWTPLEWQRDFHAGVREGLYDASIPQMREMYQRLLERPPSSEPEFDKRLIPYEGALGIGGAGNLWVMVGVPFDERSIFDVFDPSGERLASVRAPGRIYESMVVKDRWLVGIELDEMDRPRLWRHDISDVVSALASLNAQDAG